MSIEVAPGRVAMHHDQRLPHTYVHVVYVKVPEVSIVRHKRKDSGKGFRFDVKHASVPSAVLFPYCRYEYAFVGISI